MVAGSIASGATLGILIPPSINLIIYGAITDTSIGALFIAGIIPGLMLTSFFVIIIAVAATIWPAIAGDGSGRAVDRSGRWRRLIDLIGPVVIFMLIIGSIYGGWATPTEAAAMGVVASLGLAAYYRKLNLRMLNDSLLATIRITAMILFVLMGAYFLNFAMGRSAMTCSTIRRWRSSASLPPVSSSMKSSSATRGSSFIASWTWSRCLRAPVAHARPTAWSAGGAANSSSPAANPRSGRRGRNRL